MTVPEEQEEFQEICDGVWAAFCDRGVPEGSPQEIHVSWRCPTLPAAEALEAALQISGAVVGVAQPHAEAGGRGFGVAATVSVLASRQNLDDVLHRMIRLGAGHGARIVGVGTLVRE